MSLSLSSNWLGHVSNCIDIWKHWEFRAKSDLSDESILSPPKSPIQFSKLNFTRLVKFCSYRHFNQIDETSTENYLKEIICAFDNNLFVGTEWRKFAAKLRDCAVQWLKCRLCGGEIPFCGFSPEHFFCGIPPVHIFLRIFPSAHFYAPEGCQRRPLHNNNTDTNTTKMGLSIGYLGYLSTQFSFLSLTPGLAFLSLTALF